MESIHLKNLYDYAKCRNLCEEGESEIASIEEDKLISPQTYLQWAERFYRKSNDAYFGLHFGSFLSLKAMQVIFDISLTVSSIKQLTLIWEKYAAISFPLLKITPIESDNAYGLEFSVGMQSDLATQILDGIVAFSYKELKIITGHDAISIIIPNKKTAEYRLCLDCPVVEGKSHVINFNCAPELIVTNKKIRQRLETVLPAFLFHLKSLESKRESFAHQVRLMILNLCEPDCPTIEQVATQFCMSTRTLQRRMQGENTSFRLLSNEIKKELYTYLRKDDQIKTIDMSYLLGYSSSSAFLHARKAWGIL